MKNREKDTLAAPMKRFIRRYIRQRKHRRLHLSSKPIKNLKAFVHEQKPGEFYTKPAGFWYGIHDSWIQWCLSEMPHWIDPYIYEVVVDESQILKITNLQEFEAFEDKYRQSKELPFAMPENFDYFRNQNMNFTEVAKEYAGLEISPYQWGKRLESMWYYGWDVASGVIWDSEAVFQLVPFAKYDKKTNEFIRLGLQPRKKTVES